MKKLILLIPGLFFFSFIFSQNTDAVKLTELIGKYTGEMRRGLAHGEGEAVGIDTYKGEFKKGLPHGEGTYIYSTGEVYKGEFHKGQRHGWGKLTFRIEDRDSVLEGYFYEDKFLGDKKRPDPDYKVLTSLNVVRYSVIPLSETGDQVLIQFETNDDPYSLLFQANSGSKTEESTRRFRYEYVEFPFELSLRYKVPSKNRESEYDCTFEMIINKPGSWKVQLYD